MCDNSYRTISKLNRLGLEPTKVRLFPYDPQWSVEFEKERLLIENAIGEFILSVHHIGSTSIPDLCAKPIIDILIGLENFRKGFECVTGLQKRGYVFRGEHGIPGRHYFRKGTPRTHHIHMCEKQSRQWQDHLLFCNFLRNHPKIRQDYADLKEELATKFPDDRKQYTDGKSDFIQHILELARKT